MLYSLIILNTLCVAYLLYAWFNSHLTALISWIFYSLGFKRKNLNFWLIPGEEPLGNLTNYKHRSPLTWTQQDFEIFCETRLHLFFGLLFTCKYCLVAHISFWVNFVTLTTVYAFNIIDIPCALYLLYLFIFPFAISFLSLLLYSILDLLTSRIIDKE